jgi:two-component system cell cycle sensor histidine kinase/response regulator CckA
MYGGYNAGMGSRVPSTSRQVRKSRRRSLRQRTLWSIGLTIFVLVCGLYLVSRAVILNGFENLEKEDAEQNLTRAVSAFHDSEMGVSRQASDFSSWDQMYAYVRNATPAFVKSEFPNESLSTLRINFVVIADTSSHIIFKKGFDLHTQREVPVPTDLVTLVLPGTILTHFTETSSKAVGLINLRDGPAIISSQPILTSDNHGPIEGTFVVGRWVDGQELDHLGEVTHLDLNLIPLGSSQASQETAEATTHLTGDSRQYIRAIDDENLGAYRLVDDIYGKPTLILKLTLPRTFYHQGRVSLLQFMFLLLAAGAVFTAVTLIVLERLVLSRLGRLGSDVSALGASGNLAARITVPGDDELTNLGGSINRMLAALEKSHEDGVAQGARVRMLVERMPAVLWTTDINLNFVSTMGAGLKALQQRPNEISGMSIFDYYGTRDSSHESIAAHLRAINGQPSTYITIWQGRTFECHTEPLFDANNNVVGAIGIALDSTDRVQAQEALRKSESSYRSLIEEAPYGICRCTTDGAFTLVNRALVQMLGCETERELLALNLGADLFEVLQAHERFVRELTEQGSAEGIEAQWKRRDGKSMQVHLGGRAVRDMSGKIAYLEVIAEDVSDRKHLELQLRQSQKMQAIGQLAGGVAHDFNNLLMVVKGHLELILSGLKPSDPLFARLDQVQKAANRASSLTRQLLAFSRQQVLQRQVLDLNNVVSGMIQMLSRLIGENIELIFRPGSVLGRVKADAGQIEQILLNLVVNARDAMPNRGRLTIETTNVELDESYAQRHTVVKPGPYVMLAVSDTGIGMDAATQARIFEPFFTTKEAGKGTGLGLSTVYGVVKQSDGYIWVYSEVGHGTTFKIYLPLATDAVETLKPQTSAPAPAPGTETILLVEDEESVRSLVCDFLKGTGHTVLEAQDGPDAIRIARSHTGRIDLLISDVVMPKMNGREVSIELKKQMPKLKILFISGYTDDAVFRAGVLEGDVAFLQKPFTLRGLSSKIRDVLDGDADREFTTQSQEKS